VKGNERYIIEIQIRKGGNIFEFWIKVALDMMVLAEMKETLLHAKGIKSHVEFSQWMGLFKGILVTCYTPFLLDR
jgi:hypothetical protein